MGTYFYRASIVGPMSSSSANVFLVSCDSEKFERTVRSPVTLDSSEDAPGELESVDEARLWGVESSDQNRSYFEKMSADDLVLFYQDGMYAGTGVVGSTFEDESGWVASTFWEDESVPMIFTVEEFSSVSVPKSAVNRIFEYSENYTPGDLLRVADSRLRNRPEAIKLAVERYSEQH